MSIVELGKQLYHDPILSKNQTQSCAQCHNPEHGFIDNRNNGLAVSLGDDGKSVGTRNAPTASYAMLAPDFYFNKKTQEWMGGQFHDGRAKDLQAQAGGPPLFKVPTLRNIAITAPYMHNGVFRELTTVIEFYDKYLDPSRTQNPETQKPWRLPEVPATVNFTKLKKGKKLSDRKIKAIVAFLHTLTDQRYEHLISK